MKRLTSRMLIGSSISPRRHFCSQKAGQTRPQIRANGLRWRWIARPFGVAALGDQRQVGRAFHAGRAGVDALGAHQRLALAGRADLVVDVPRELLLEEAQGRHHRAGRQLAQGAQATRSACSARCT